MKKMVIAAAAACAALSCAPRIRTDYYLINTEPAVAKSASRLPLTVVINHVRAPSRYQDQIAYRTSEFRVGFYEYSRWAEPPAEMVWRAIHGALSASGLFERAEPSDAAWNPDLILQCAIIAFDQVLEKGGEYADCRLAMELLTMDTRKVVWSKRTGALVKQEKRGAFVAAMERAVARAVSDAVADMEGSAALREAAAGKGAAKP